MYKDTITLFNRVKQRNGDIWIPSVLEGVNINLDKGSIIKTYGPESQDNAILNVGFTDAADGRHVGDKIWLPPKEWQRLSDRTGYLTFTDGNAFDFFWMGIWNGSESISDDNYGDMSFYDYMLQNYDFVYAITSIGIMTVIPHFEVVGR